MTTPNDETTEMMVAREEGRRAAARGRPAYAENPYLKLAEAWSAAFTEVDARRLEGKDRAGHTPPPPHLCAADPRNVCNCCPSCTRGCMPSVGDVLRSVAGRVLHRIGVRRAP